MKISGADLPIEIDGGDETQTVLVLKNLAGDTLLEVKGDGTVKANGVTVYPTPEPQVVDSGSVTLAADLHAALVTLGLVVDEV